MTRSCAATWASRSAVLLTSREMALVLGRSAPRALALSRVRQALLCFSVRHNMRYTAQLTNRKLIGRVAHDVLGTGTRNKAAAKKEDLLDGLGQGRGSSSPSEFGQQILALLQERAPKLGEIKGRLVEGGVVVPGILDRTHGRPEVPPGFLGAHNEPDLTRGVCRDGGVRVLGNGEEAAGHGPQLGDEGEVQPEAFPLCGDVAPWGEGIVEELEIGLLEEGLGGTDGV